MIGVRMLKLENVFELDVYRYVLWDENIFLKVEAAEYYDLR